MRFTVRRPANAEVSPCCHLAAGRAAKGRVACGVHVGIARPRTTSDTLENRLALTVFRRDMPTVRAPLRRERCRDEFDSPRSLVRQPGDQHPPPLAADLTVKTPLLRHVDTRTLPGAARRTGHRTHLQILHADGVEPARQVGGGLFHRVTAAIRLTGPQPGDGPLGARPPLRSPARPGQPPLPLSFPGAQSRDIQKVPVGQRHRNRYAAIDTHDAAVIGARDRLRDGGKGDVPAPRPILSDSVGLHGIGDGAGPAEPHPTNLGDPNPPVAAAEALDVARFDSDLPESFMLAGLAPGRATVGAVEKVVHRLGEVPQRLLLHGLRSSSQPVVFGAGRGQLRTLLAVSGCMAARLPMPLLLHGQIPHKPRMATMLSQHRRLLNAGQQPKPRHPNNITRTTDKPTKRRRRRFLPRLKPGVSTPQIS